MPYENKYSELRNAYINLIMEGAYSYYITLTFTSAHSTRYMTEQANFLLMMLSKRIFRHQNKICLEGYAILEKSNSFSKCDHHYHILLKSNPQLDRKCPFIQLFTKYLPRVKAKVGSILTCRSEFNNACVDIKPITSPEGLIGYLTKQFWIDKNGEFIKYIGPDGIEDVL